MSVPPAVDQTPWRVTWPIFALLVVACLVATIGFPVFQAVKTGGYVYYVNGSDETTYLLAEFSRAAQSATRPGQYLISAGHMAGLSGGWLNLIMDGVMVMAFPLLVRACLRQAGWSSPQANVGALLALTLPQLLMLSNPPLGWLEAKVARSSALSWFNMPGITPSPFWRTPEPQFSLMLLGTAALAGLRWRSFWPVYAVLPFLYPFVAIPAAFVTLAAHVHHHWPRVSSRFRVAGPLLLAFLSLGTACLAYYAILVPAGTKKLVLASHWPLISLTGMVALALYLVLRRGMAERERFVALALAFAPWVACNQQVISGYVPQPDNFESYAGTLAVALIVALGVRTRPWLGACFLAAGLAMFGHAAYGAAKSELAFFKSMPLTPELAAALQADPGLVVINHVDVSSLMDLVHPRQGATALSFGTTFAVSADRHIGAYRCVKKQVLAEHPDNESFANAFFFLDNAYAYGSQNYHKATIGRKKTFEVLQNVDPGACTEAGKLPLRYFWVR